MKRDASYCRGRTPCSAAVAPPASKRVRKTPDDLRAQRLVVLYIFFTDERSTVDAKFIQKRLNFSACVPQNGPCRTVLQHDMHTLIRSPGRRQAYQPQPCRTQFKTETAFKRMGVRMRGSLLSDTPDATGLEFAALAHARYLELTKKDQSGDQSGDQLCTPLQLYPGLFESSRPLVCQTSHRVVPLQPALAPPSAEDFQAVYQQLTLLQQSDTGSGTGSDADSDADNGADRGKGGGRCTWAAPLMLWNDLLERYDAGCSSTRQDVGADLRDFVV